MKTFIISAAALCLAAPLSLRAGGDEVAVVYNLNMPGSKAVAEHYAAARQVPTNHIFGLALSINEEISRADYSNSLHKPLVEKLVTTGLWKFGNVSFPATNGRPAVVENRVVQSKIRYLALCYGVPLKIAQDANLKESGEKDMGAAYRFNQAAVDSELTLLPLCKIPSPLTGIIPNRFYGLTNQSLLHPTNGILMVTRLDGPTAEIASALVDKALEAERNGFWGRAYFDTRGLSPSNAAYYLGDQWLTGGAEICRLLGFEVEIDKMDGTIPASFPMSHIAIYAGWYCGDASGPFALPKVEFMPGAFAYHIYSYSGCTLRSPSNAWCGPLLAKGATCTMGCVYEPYLQFTPNIALFLQAFGSGFTFAEAAWISQNSLSWQNTVIGDPLYQPFKKQPADLHAELARTKNPLIEWSFHRLVCLDLAHGLRETQLAPFVQSLPTTAQSAILTEKLASLYAALGKPGSAIDRLEEVLKLKPSPQQRIRIRLALAEKYAALDRHAEGVQNYKNLIAEAPDYPGKPAILEKLKALEQKLAAKKKP